jgi:hypothetical protein
LMNWRLCAWFEVELGWFFLYGGREGPGWS